VRKWFAAGADEVITPLFEPGEQAGRLDALVTRAQRDVAVYPSTRLPGTTEIEREIKRRMELGEFFAVCYADLDHFKEFNDRYSYYDGDRVIYLLSRILHDVVRGMIGKHGFVGHIGGDDFIFVLLIDSIAPVCSEVLEVFDTLVPFQVQRAGPPGGLLLRQGPARTVAPRAADDAVDRRGHESAPALCAPRAGQRAGDGNEELRQDAGGLGIRGRSPPRSRCD
jgi:diguanylate cyclase (GGDEF)-like protein